jgi:hypothetical protein
VEREREGRKEDRSEGREKLKRKKRILKDGVNSSHYNIFTTAVNCFSIANKRK